MVTKALLLAVLLAAVLGGDGSSFAAGKGGVVAKIRQLPPVHGVVEALQWTGGGLAYRVLAFGMLAAATCGTMGCNRDTHYDPSSLSREEMLNNTSNDMVGKKVYLFNDEGNAYLADVLGGQFEGDWFFLVRLEDGTEEIVRENQIAGEMLRDSFMISVLPLR